MFDLRNNSLRELIRTQHREFMLYLEERGEEFRKEFLRRDEEMKAEFRRRDEEMREFNREILLRNEKVYKSVIAEMEKSTKQLEEGTKQIQANTRAVLSVLDRLDAA